MNCPLLSEGSLTALGSGQSVIEPVLQVTDVRSLLKEGGSERFRLLLSDGVYTQQGMLATQLNDFVKSGQMGKGSIIKLLTFVCNVIYERMIIIISDIEVIHASCDIIGNPRSFPLKIDENVTGGGGGGMPSQSMNQPAAVRPSYGSSPVRGAVPRPNIVTPVINSDPRPNVYGASQATTRPNIVTPVMNSDPSPNVYGASQATKPNMGGNPYGGGGGSAVPTYQKTEYGSGVNNNIRPSVSYINQPQPSVYNQQRPQAPYNQRPPSSYNQRPAMYANRAPVGKNEAATRIMPISALNPYQGRWTIKARVTVKKELRTYTNAKGTGKVFSFDLLDSDGGEIRVTCFNEIVDQFYNVIEQGGVYMISRGSLKQAKKDFNHLPNEYEIFLDSTSTIEPCFEDDKSIPEQQFHFRSICDIEGLNNGSVLDVIGVVTSVDEPRSITRKDNTVTPKRTLQMTDTSGRSVEITLWGNFCSAEGSELQGLCVSGNYPVVALKSGRVNEFNGKSVGTTTNSLLFINPDFPETQNLRAWFDTEGKSTPAISLSREFNLNVRKVISQIKDENLGTSEKADWITVPATVTFMKVTGDSFYYTACPLKVKGTDRMCSKKVIYNGDGKYHCERCDEVMDKCDYRYILQMAIQDHTGLTWVTAFQESGVEIMGISAEQLHNLKQEDEGRFNELVQNVLFTKFVFKLKVKEEVYNDDRRVKSTVVKAEKLNFQTETKFLLDSIVKLEQGDSGSLPQPAPRGVFGAGNRETPTPAMNYSGITSNATRDSIYTSQAGSYGNKQNTGSNFVLTGSASYTNCTSCGGTGHSSIDCPSLIPAPKQSYGSGFGNNVSPRPSVVGATGDCYKCHQNGHWAKDCPGTGNVSPAYVSGNVGGRFGNNASHGPSAGGMSVECFKCHQFGHFANNCPGNVPPAYGGSANVGLGRYGPNQQAGF